MQRLFGHFGLDPADYVESFAHPVDAAEVPGASGRADDAGAAAEPDRLDYRNLEPTG